MIQKPFTPGPWKSFEAGSEGARILPNTGNIREDLKFIAIVNGRDTLTDFANARLIAAAPDLLQELKHLVSLLEPLEQNGGLEVPGLATLNGARAAIKSAEGK